MTVFDNGSFLPGNGLDLELKEVFDRNRVSAEVKAFAVYLYSKGLSLRKLSRILEDFGVRVSHVAIWKWVQKTGERIRELSPFKKERSCLLIDETLIKFQEGQIWVFAAMDPENREIVEIEASKHREISDVLLFFKKALNSCENKPTIITDGGRWYKWPATVLDLEHRIVRGEKRNYVERWFKILKNRLNNFDNYFPTKDLETIQNFIKVFQHQYNHTRHHQTLHKPPLQPKQKFRKWIKTLS